MRTTPLRSDPADRSTQSLSEQLRWIEEYADLAIAASGIHDGWLWLHDSVQLAWNGHSSDRAAILGSLLPQWCAGGGHIVHSLIVRNIPAFHEVTERLRAHWAEAWVAAGWATNDVRETGSRSGTYIRADRADGALLFLQANRTRMVLGIDGPCSNDPTMVDPMRGMRERDAFIDEVRSR